MARSTGFFNVDPSEVYRLHEKVKRLGEESENVVNEVLIDYAVDEIGTNISDFINVSKKNKEHAKHSKWWTYEAQNLGIIVKSAGGAANKPGSWGYLVFPDEGRGPNQPFAQDFARKGSLRAAPKIVEKLHEVINLKLEEVMNNG